MLRLIDANLNRLGEGLRVLEDIARFLLNDPSLTSQLRDLRHELSHLPLPFQLQLLSQRDVSSDVGILREGAGRGDVLELAKANARRAEEALRVLEEFCPSPGGSTFRQARFKLYDLEKTLFSQLLRQGKREKIKGLYVILDTQALRGRDELQIAEEIIRGGANIIQFRDKGRDRGEILPITQGLRELCVHKDVLFIINDHLDLVLATNADGLHIGQKDLPLSKARELLPIDKLIGVSTHNLEQALRAQQEGADYIAVGSIYPTPSKQAAIVVGLETLSQIRKSISLPIVAIGGINRDNVREVIKVGADAVAVISAVLDAEDVEGETRQLMGVMNEKGN